METNGTDKFLAEIGYFVCVTPKGRKHWVNPAFYPPTPEELADTDEYLDYLDTLPETYPDEEDY